MPTDKRARQKEGRRQRLEAERKSARQRRMVRRAFTIVIIAAVVVGTVFLLTKNNSNTSTTTTSTTVKLTADQALQKRLDARAAAHGCPSDPTLTTNKMKYSAAPAMTIDTSGTYTATFDTDAGTFTVNLLAQQAPTTVNNFVFLARQGFYKCVSFHRVIPKFMNQSGDPTGTGSGGPGYTIPDENMKTTFGLGAVAMANTGAKDTGGSQFFVVAGSEGYKLPTNAAGGYALFGQVTSGMKAVEKINAFGDASDNGSPPDVIFRIYNITITGP